MKTSALPAWLVLSRVYSPPSPSPPRNHPSWITPRGPAASTHWCCWAITPIRAATPQAPVPRCSGLRCHSRRADPARSGARRPRRRDGVATPGGGIGATGRAGTPATWGTCSSWRSTPPGPMTSVQQRWLQQTLATAKDPWEIVAMHYPPHSAGWHGVQYGDARCVSSPQDQQAHHDVAPGLGHTGGRGRRLPGQRQDGAGRRPSRLGMEHRPVVVAAPSRSRWWSGPSAAPSAPRRPPRVREECPGAGPAGRRGHGREP